tara:strand:- start:1374 stop:1874 length:501 start_codon:yes stop_codon:yes gene_type:complete
MNFNYIVPSLTFLAFGIFCKTFHTHYLDRKINHDRAILYLSSDVCKKAELRIQLGTYARCTHSEQEIAISPFLHSVYDVLEDYWICGHDKCSAMMQWVNYNKFPLLGVFCFVLWVLYQYFMFSFYVTSTRASNYELPLKGLRDNPRSTFVEYNSFAEFEEENDNSI